MKNRLALQIKPAGNECNINCSYCYASPYKNHKIKIMDDEVVDNIINKITADIDELTISWHGGEPTLAGLHFYEKFCEKLNRNRSANTSVTNRIQTNATLIDDAFAEFFFVNNFIVSVSLDGPKELHNKNRYDFAKNGTFDRTMNGIEILRKHGIEPQIMITVSKTNINHAEEIFKFIIENDFKRVKFNPIYDSHRDEFSISNKKWLSFMKKIFVLWISSRKSDLHIREIDSILNIINGIDAGCCNGAAACLRWISIDPNGSLYPCEYFRASRSYGNIKQVNFKDILSNDNYVFFSELFSKLPRACTKCKYIKYCGNGCPATRSSFHKLKPDGKYVYCKYIKKSVQYVRDYIKKLEGGERHEKKDRKKDSIGIST